MAPYRKLGSQASKVPLAERVPGTSGSWKKNPEVGNAKDSAALRMGQIWRAMGFGEPGTSLGGALEYARDTPGKGAGPFGLERVPGITALDMLEFEQLAQQAPAFTGFEADGFSKDRSGANYDSLEGLAKVREVMKKQAPDEYARYVKLRAQDPTLAGISATGTGAATAEDIRAARMAASLTAKERQLAEAMSPNFPPREAHLVYARNK